MKNGFEPSNIYSFSRRIRIRIQNWTKTTPKPDFYDFLKNPDFYKNPIFIDFYRGGGIGRRPFLIHGGTRPPNAGVPFLLNVSNIKTNENHKDKQCTSHFGVNFLENFIGIACRDVLFKKIDEKHILG